MVIGERPWSPSVSHLSIARRSVAGWSSAPEPRSSSNLFAGGTQVAAVQVERAGYPRSVSAGLWRGPGQRRGALSRVPAIGCTGVSCQVYCMLCKLLRRRCCRCCERRGCRRGRRCRSFARHEPWLLTSCSASSSARKAFSAGWPRARWATCPGRRAPARRWSASPRVPPPGVSAPPPSGIAGDMGL